MKKRMFVPLLLFSIVIGCSDHKQPESLGEIVNRHGNITHLEKADEFLAATQSQQAISLRVTHYTIEGDPIYRDLTYINNQINIRYDTTKDKFGNGKITENTCTSMEKTDTDTQLSYQMKGCSGDADIINVLTISFDVEKQDRFEFILKYGVQLKNELDTSEKKLVKDLQNGEVIPLTNFVLTASERQSIYKKLVLSNYLAPKQLSTVCNQKPHTGYYLQVLINRSSREFSWTECDRSKDGQSMTSIVDHIIELLKNNSHYKELPEVKGSYL